MPYVITDRCLDEKDQSCIEVCPVDCIYDVGDMMIISPGECIDCGACVPECPVEAIFPRAELPEEAKHFAEINAFWDDGGVEAVTAALQRAT